MKKRTVKLITVVVLAMFMLCITSVPGSAVSYIVDGDWRYEMTPANDCYYIAGYLGDSETVSFPPLYNDKPVVKISDSAFFENSKIMYMNFPATITEIGKHAFYGSTSLKVLQLPQTISKIGAYSFSNCSALSSVTVEAKPSLKRIPAYTFSTCKNLTSVTLPQGVESIGAYAFNYCEKLTSVIIPASVNSIETTAFYNTPELTIYGWSGTYAETYANTMNIPFYSYGTYVEPTTVAPTTAPEVTSTAPETTVVTDPAETTAAPTTAPQVITTAPETTGETGTIATEVPIPTGPIQTMPSFSSPDDTNPTTEPTTHPGTEYIIGDVDLNGKISVKDATIIQKYVAHLVILSHNQLYVANCDSMGGVNVKDATLIQKYVANFPVESLVGQKVYL